MSSVYDFLTQALHIQNLKEYNSEYVTDCPACGKSKKFWINKDTGLAYCQSGGCNYKANPYLLARKVLGIRQLAAMKLLVQYGLADPGRLSAKPTVDSNLPKFESLRELTEPELQQFCRVKGISKESLLGFNPRYYERSQQGCVALPGWG